MAQLVHHDERHEHGDEQDDRHPPSVSNKDVFVLNNSFATFLIVPTVLRCSFAISSNDYLMCQIPYFKEGEVWSCYLGENIGHEQNGTGRKLLRPVAILKKYNKNLFLGIPLTSKYKKLSFYYPIGNVCGKDASAILVQCRSLSSQRLRNKLDVLDGRIFKKMKSAARAYSFGS